MRPCARCGEPLEPDSAPNRRNCRRPACVKQVSRESSRAHEAKVVALGAPKVENPSQSVLVATTEALEMASGPLVASALALAARIDAQQDTGSALAAMVRELRATIEAALSTVATSGDQIDELSQRRRKRLAGA